MSKHWIRRSEGSVFVVVALATMAVVGSVGVAVDIGRSQMVQAKLQNAVDSAGLAAGATISSTDLTAVATKYINVNFAQGNLGAVLNPIETSLSEDKKILTVTASAVVPTTFTRIFRTSNVEVNATTEVTRSNKGLELAMVLDTTGSMGGSKLTALKSAAHDLTDILFGDEETAENLWVGVVPFSQSVNIGPSRTNWLDAAHYSGLNWGTTSWAGCVDARNSTGRDVTDDPPYDLLHPSDAVPAAPYERLKAYYWQDDGNNDWISTSTTTTCSNKSSCTCSNYGPCTTTVSGNVTTTKSCTGNGNSASCKSVVTTYTYSSSKGPNKNCPSVLTPLTNVKATVEAGIDALVARGNTHINFGAVWGWRLISPRWRGYWGGDMDANALPLNYNAPLMSKAVIIMTDGENTSGSSVKGAYGYYDSNTGQVSASQLNDKTTEVCNKLKAEGVIVYTILFQQNSNTVKTLLRNCATNPDYFFDSPTSESLQTAFHTIGDSLANLRISK